jgi:hypothetical protein
VCEHGSGEWVAEILHRLGDPKLGLPSAGDVAPRLFIHERCARLVECLPVLQHNPNRPEDVLKIDADEDGVGGDDAADGLPKPTTRWMPQLLKPLRGT